ncbi:hypothetical protein [Oceanobacillus neutriphilus]|uniref:Cell division protein FtsL n=1 Tax=Oceanobacillus neutriphilus TaxID=531815 RepID=A0ABQ2P3E6_9BACI|nr:hypothetical protein [Oceanobacillus neutriphilus]GGP17152.1 hypothetical protein GCM10011346_51940 [Oceanobacillus neutriphilus]
MKRKILDYGLRILLVLAFMAIFALANEVYQARTENEQLQQEKAELQLEYYKMQIQRDEAVDAVWSNNHGKMMEGEVD